MLWCCANFLTSFQTKGNFKMSQIEFDFVKDKKATLTENPMGSFTMFRIRGDAEAVRKLREKYFQNYPKAGYRTEILEFEENDIQGRRYSSCD